MTEENLEYHGIVRICSQLLDYKDAVVFSATGCAATCPLYPDNQHLSLRQQARYISLLDSDAVYLNAKPQSSLSVTLDLYAFFSLNPTVHAVQVYQMDVICLFNRIEYLKPDFLHRFASSKLLLSVLGR